jgi:hypothetical protein
VLILRYTMYMASSRVNNSCGQLLKNFQQGARKRGAASPLHPLF